jgi:hypothetical protein
MAEPSRGSRFIDDGMRGRPRATMGEGRMDENEDLGELERQIERAKRLASNIGDQTTSQRIWGFVDELRRKLQRRLAARRLKPQIRARAHELWEQHGRPSGRDVEFWLQAEEEVIGGRTLPPS